MEMTTLLGGIGLHGGECGKTVGGLKRPLAGRFRQSLLSEGVDAMPVG